MSVSLVQFIEKLPAIPGDAAKEFADSRGSIIARVNSAMEARDDLTILTGGNPVSVVRDNHVNHANTMAVTFGLGSLEILAMTAPWVYRSYIYHGFSPDYFPVLFSVFRDNG